MTNTLAEWTKIITKEGQAMTDTNVTIEQPVIHQDLTPHVVDTRTEGSNVPAWYGEMREVIKDKKNTEIAPIRILNIAGENEVATWHPAEGKANNKWYKDTFIGITVGMELAATKATFDGLSSKGDEAKREQLSRDIKYGVHVMKQAKLCVQAMTTLRREGYIVQINPQGDKVSLTYRPFRVNHKDKLETQDAQYFSVPQLISTILKVAQLKPEYKGNVAELKSLVTKKKGKGPDQNKNGDAENGVAIPGVNKGIRYTKLNDQVVPAIQSLLLWYDDKDHRQAVTQYNPKNEMYREIYDLTHKLMLALGNKATEPDKIAQAIDQFFDCVVSPETKEVQEQDKAPKEQAKTDKTTPKGTKGKTKH